LAIGCGRTLPKYIRVAVTFRKSFFPTTFIENAQVNLSMTDALSVINLIIGIFTVWQSLISIYKFYRRRLPVSTDTELRRNKETITSNKRKRIDEKTNLEQRHADITVNIRNNENVTIAYNGLGVSINYCTCCSYCPSTLLNFNFVHFNYSLDGKTY